VPAPMPASHHSTPRWGARLRTAMPLKVKIKLTKSAAALAPASAPTSPARPAEAGGAPLGDAALMAAPPADAQVGVDGTAVERAATIAAGPDPTPFSPSRAPALPAPGSRS